jgi:prepilin-type N-terminal cleavage/methylation domain-containing protein
VTAVVRSERGFTLIEVLVAMVISLIVLGATLSVIDSLWDNARRSAEHNEAQDTARTYLDRLARQLRNLASPTIFAEDYEAEPYAIDNASAYDFVFRVVDQVREGSSLNLANVKRVRYCLDATDRERGRLYEQEQTWTDSASSDPPDPPKTQCGVSDGASGTKWTSTKLVTDHVTNRSGGHERPVFVFNSAYAERISQVHAELYVDPYPTRAPAETRLASGVTLRNQNRRPVASIATAPSTGGVVLNGSGSADPEARPLTYQWYAYPNPPYVEPPSDLPDCHATPRPANCLGEGVVIDAQLPASTYHIVLVVTDPAGLLDREETTVTIL